MYEKNGEESIVLCSFGTDGGFSASDDFVCEDGKYADYRFLGR